MTYGQYLSYSVRISWADSHSLKYKMDELFEDFIDNFNLADLDDKQVEELSKLKISNQLVESLVLHMEELNAKRKKKKNKRELQKLNKKNTNKSIGPLDFNGLLDML